MFDIITEKSHKHLQDQIDQLKAYCDKDESVAELIRYILVYANEQSVYTDRSLDARIGSQISMFIYEIAHIDLASLTNSFHFPVDWAANLNSFIGNFIYDDAAFTFTRSYNRTFRFDAHINDTDMWLQDPKILIEAAKVNAAYYDELERVGIFGTRDFKLDDTKVIELLK